MDGIELFDEASRREVFVSSLPAPSAPQGHRIQRKSAVRISDVKSAVRRYYDLEDGALSSHARYRAWAWPRQLACYLARELTGCSYPLIGREFGGRDHTTILFSWRKIKALRPQNEALDEALDDLTAMVLVERERREEREAELRRQADEKAWETLGEAKEDAA